MPDADKHYTILKVSIAGEEIEASYVRDVTVKDNLSTPDTAVVTLVQASVPASTGASGTAPDMLDDTRFDLGKDLSVSAGSLQDTAAEKIFEGVIVSIEPEFTRSKTSMVVRAYDKSFFMTQEPKSRTWQSQTTRQIAMKLLEDAGLSPSVDIPEVRHDFMFQANETDWDFLQRLARKHNLELIVSGGTASLTRVDRSRPDSGVTLNHPRAGGDPATTLIDFSPRASLAQQPKEVSVRFWNETTGKLEVASAKTNGVRPMVEAKGFAVGTLSKAARSDKMVVAGRPAATMEDASKRAEALAARLVDAGVQATGTAMGNPKLKAGSSVTVGGVGNRFSGTYALSSTTHVYRQGGSYRTKFAITGRNSNSLVDLLGGGGAGANGNGGRSWAQGLVVGIVTNVQDKNGLGRVRVKFPALNEQEEGWWARIATLHAGSDRGVYFRPEVGDEVVCGFEHADITRPYVLGCVFNGAAKPGKELFAEDNNQAKDGSLFIKTPKQFVMKTGDEMKMITGKSHTLEVAAESKQTIGKDLDIKVDGASIHKAAKTITIESGPMQKIVIKAGGDLELQAGSPAGAVKITGGKVDITGQMGVNVKGATINLG